MGEECSTIMRQENCAQNLNFFPVLGTEFVCHLAEPRRRLNMILKWL
jgi:hypothetical protein